MDTISDIIGTLQKTNSIKKENVYHLYRLSEQTLMGIFGLIVVVFYFLYPVVDKLIVIWSAVMIGVVSVRIYHIYQFKRDKKRQKNYLVWYRKFFISSLVKATVSSALGFFFIPLVGLTEQMFIIASLIGLSAGAISSLYPDMRLGFIYTIIILLPLSIAVMAAGDTPHMILSLMLFGYCWIQLMLIYNIHRQNMELEKRQQDIIDAQKELIRNKETFQRFYQQAPIGIMFYDLDLKVADCNNAFLSLFARERREMIGLDMCELPDKTAVIVAKKALNDGFYHYVGPYHSSQGLKYWTEVKSFAISNAKGDIVGGTMMIENKTNEHEAVERLEYLASHDPLTKLLNRRGFKEAMTEMIDDPKHTRYHSILFYLDLNRFKYINDSLGHSFGDKMLKEVAKRLVRFDKGDYRLSRLGGDEFVVVIPFVSEDAYEVEERAKAYSQEIDMMFEEPFVIENIRLYMKSSIGVVIIQPGFNDIEEIVRHADISMYQAKKESHTQISFYSHQLDRERKEIFSLQQDLIYAVKEDLFEIYLQPILRISDDSVHAAEALIRWIHPEKGVLLPDTFIPLAIELGIITEIGWRVFEKVCQTISEWKREGVWNLEYISVNIDAKQLIEYNFNERFFGEIERYGIDTKDILVEITETSLIDNFVLAEEIILELRERGIRCAIDDFGIGYSSLSYLKKLSFSILKIDKEFICDLEKHQDSEDLIHTIIKIAKQFNYHVIIEGIENEKQKKIIASIDNTLSYQGYLANHPLSIEDFRGQCMAKGAVAYPSNNLKSKTEV